MERFPGEFPSYIGTPESIPADAAPWERVVRLERQREWLDLKCDDLRRSCREITATLNGRSPLSPADAAVLGSAPSHRPMDEVFTDFRRLRESFSLTPPRPVGESDEALTTRADAVAAAVAARREERAELRRMFLALMDVVMPDEPLTDEQIAEMVRVMNGPPGPSILDVIAEVETELARGS